MKVNDSCLTAFFSCIIFGTGLHFSAHSRMFKFQYFAAGPLSRECSNTPVPAHSYKPTEKGPNGDLWEFLLPLPSLGAVSSLFYPAFLQQPQTSLIMCRTAARGVCSLPSTADTRIAAGNRNVAGAPPPQSPVLGSSKHTYPKYQQHYPHPRDCRGSHAPPGRPSC